MNSLTYNALVSELGGLLTSTVEITTGIIAACIPTYKALVNIVFQRRVISTLGSHRFRSRREDGIELMNDAAESTKSDQSGRIGWGKIKQETTISQIHQSSLDTDKGAFGISNAIGKTSSTVPAFEERVWRQSEKTLRVSPKSIVSVRIV